MLAMLASLVSRLRSRIQEIEQGKATGDLKVCWDLLRDAEWLVYRDHALGFPEKSKEIKDKLKKMLGVKL